MARREARYWSRLGEAVEGMVGGAPCWARANRAMRTGAAKRTVRDGMAGMLSRRFIRPVRGRFGLHYGGIAAVYSRRTCVVYRYRLIYRLIAAVIHGRRNADCNGTTRRQSVV